MEHISMPHMNGHLLAAVDVETSGGRAGYHDILQIAIVPLNHKLEPADHLRPFYYDMKPIYPERAEHEAMKVNGLDLNHLAIHALHPNKIADMFADWWENLELPHDRKLIPLAHNWTFEFSFLCAWLSVEMVRSCFHFLPRDAMILANALNDRAFICGLDRPFESTSLTNLAGEFGIATPNAHDAYADCVVEAKVYKNLLQMY